MSKRSFKLYLDDIRDSIRKIERYTKDLSRTEFIHDELRVDAVVRNLEIMGEAAKNLPKEFRAKHKAAPWAQMIGMRNKVIHEYFGVNEDILWKTVSKDLPQLKKLLKPLVDEEERWQGFFKKGRVTAKKFKIKSEDDIDRIIHDR